MLGNLSLSLCSKLSNVYFHSKACLWPIENSSFPQVSEDGSRFKFTVHVILHGGGFGSFFNLLKDFH